MGFVADFGVVFGRPEYTISATSPGADQAQLQRDLAAERDLNQADMDAFQFYPVLGLGLSFRC